ncbi:MAG: hypothetical protein PHQ23_04475 [Candidatus Wallbacteria bacterium]|nr:hypothetical protein [Candidatus Wallbacteria bacterium]
MKWLCLIVFFLHFLSCPAGSPDFLVEVKVRYLKHNYYNQWKEGFLKERQGYGVAVAPNSFLIPAELIANSTVITISAQGSDPVLASVRHVDFDACLALISADEPEKLRDITPVSLCESYNSGQKVELHGFNDAAARIIDEGTISDLFLQESSYSYCKYLEISVMSMAEFVLGKPVTDGKKLIGMCNDSIKDQARLHVISPEVIRHYLVDFQDGHYDGFPCNIINYMELKGHQSADFLGFDREKYSAEKGFPVGVILHNIGSSTPLSSPLQTNDLLLAVDGAAAGSRGCLSLEHKSYGKNGFTPLYTTLWERELDFRGLLNCFYYPGETVEMTVFRSGGIQKLDLKLRRYEPQDFLVPYSFYNQEQPHYLVYGGLVFIELSCMYLQSWNDYLKKAPVGLVRLYDQNRCLLAKDAEKIVIIGAFLPDRINYDFKSRVIYSRVTSINGIKTTGLKSVRSALNLETDRDIVEFQDTAFKAVFPKTEVREANVRIQENYRIGSMDYLSDY